MSVSDAMKVAVTKHFPVYPVCDAQRGCSARCADTVLFEAQAFEFSAQPGAMVGVEKEERLSTHWARSLKFAASVAAAQLCSRRSSPRRWSGFFEHTLDRIVLLAVFLPVLAGQSGNTGCQALAVTLRGHHARRTDARKSAGAGEQGSAAGAAAMARSSGSRAGLGMLVYALDAEEPGGIDARGDHVAGDDRELRDQRRLRRARAAHAEEARRRPGDGLEHLPDDRDGRGQHGDIPRVWRRL